MRTGRPQREEKPAPSGEANSGPDFLVQVTSRNWGGCKTGNGEGAPKGKSCRVCKMLLPKKYLLQTGV